MPSPKSIRALLLLLCATLSALAFPAHAKPQSATPYATQYLAAARRTLISVQNNAPQINRVAELIAARHLKGGMIGSVFHGQSLEEELTGRAGGLTHMGFDRAWSRDRTPEMNAHNVAFIGWERAPAPADLATLQKLHDEKTYIVGFGPRRLPALANHVKLCDAFFDTGFGADDRVVKLKGGAKAGHANLLVNMLNGWTLTGEIVAALTRQGQMPTMWKSWMYPEGREWSDKYFGKTQFHDDFIIAPIPAGTLTRAYLQEIRANITRFETQLPQVATAAAQIADELKAGRKTLVATQGHAPFRYVGYYEDARWTTLVDFDGSSEAHIGAMRATPDGALVLRLGYHGLRQNEAAVLAEKKQRVLLVTVPTPRPEFQPPPGIPLTIDMGWTYGDAAVPIAGYPINVLPPSGIMQIIAYESINTEVLSRLPKEPEARP